MINPSVDMVILLDCRWQLEVYHIGAGLYPVCHHCRCWNAILIPAVSMCPSIVLSTGVPLSSSTKATLATVVGGVLRLGVLGVASRLQRTPEEAATEWR